MKKATQEEIKEKHRELDGLIIFMEEQPRKTELFEAKIKSLKKKKLFFKDKINSYST